MSTSRSRWRHDARRDPCALYLARRESSPYLPLPEYHFRSDRNHRRERNGRKKEYTYLPVPYPVSHYGDLNVTEKKKDTKKKKRTKTKTTNKTPVIVVMVVATVVAIAATTAAASVVAKIVASVVVVLGCGNESSTKSSTSST